MIADASNFVLRTNSAADLQPQLDAKGIEAIYFGSTTPHIFGWIHHVHTAAQPKVGLVLCNPFGYEAVCAHRTLRHLARSATDLGMPCIRFDYHGTGDSAGDDNDPDRVAAWLNSIHDACDVLKKRTGATQIYLLGIRLGALLAAHVANQRDDIAGLIAITPVTNGRTYLRELRVLHAAVTPYAAATNGVFESAGFIMSTPTVAEVNQLSMPMFHGQHILVLDRENFPMAQQWSKQLQSGNTVDYRTTREYELLSAPPHSPQLPQHIIDVTRDWLAAAVDACSVSPAVIAKNSLIVGATMQLPTGVIETTHWLEGMNMPFAIITTPALQNIASSKHGVLMLNAGATHHIGSGRLYVTLARCLALQGHVVMRLDLMGLGDSPALPNTPENIVYCAHARRDIQLAINTLQQHYGCTTITSMGMCAGGYHSLKAALEGTPLHRIILINPLTFYWRDDMPLTPDFEMEAAAEITERYKRNAFKLKTWRKIFGSIAAIRKLIRIAALHMANSVVIAKRNFLRLLGRPITDDLAADIQQVLRQGTQVTMIFSDRSFGLQRMRMQGGSALAGLIRQRYVELFLIADANHTFTQLEHREQLMALIAQTLQRLS